MFNKAFVAFRLIFGAAALYQSLAGGGGAAMAAAYNYWDSNPHVAGILLTMGVGLVLFAIWRFATVPNKGQLWPIPQRWYYGHWLRRISLKLGHFEMGTRSYPGEKFAGPAFVFGFKIRVRPNWKPISPKKLFLKSATGRTINLTIEGQAADEIDEMPQDQWHHCRARFLLDDAKPDDGRSNHPSPDQFFRYIGDFEVVFEYDGRTFRRRYSSRSLRRLCQTQLEDHSRTPERKLSLKAEPKRAHAAP